jgi:TolB protein
MTARRRTFLKRAAGMVAVALLATHTVRGADPSEELQFRADVYAWFPSGRVARVSPGDGIYYQACVHPAGTHVVYSGGRSGTPRILQTNLKTGNTSALTPKDVSARHPVYSPDGSQIAFAADFDHKQPRERLRDMNIGGEPSEEYKLNIYASDQKGDNLTRVTSGEWFDRRPAWGPDGKWIAFVSNREGKTYELWKVQSNGKSAPASILKEGIGYRPWFSLDGKTIYFFSIIRDRHQICSVLSSGGIAKPMPNDDQGDSRGPFADPLGNRLLMHSDRGGDWQIYELPLDGEPPVQLRPPGITEARHATRARNGMLTFDVIEQPTE